MGNFLRDFSKFANKTANWKANEWQRRQGVKTDTRFNDDIERLDAARMQDDLTFKQKEEQQSPFRNAMKQALEPQATSSLEKGIDPISGATTVTNVNTPGKFGAGNLREAMKVAAQYGQPYHGQTPEQFDAAQLGMDKTRQDMTIQNETAPFRQRLLEAQTGNAESDAAFNKIRPEIEREKIAAGVADKQEQRRLEGMKLAVAMEPRIQDAEAAAEATRPGAFRQFFGASSDADPAKQAKLDALVKERTDIVKPQISPYPEGTLLRKGDKKYKVVNGQPVEVL